MFRRRRRPQRPPTAAEKGWDLVDPTPPPKAQASPPSPPSTSAPAELPRAVDGLLLVVGGPLDGWLMPVPTSKSTLTAWETPDGFVDASYVHAERFEVCRLIGGGWGQVWGYRLEGERLVFDPVYRSRLVALFERLEVLFREHAVHPEGVGESRRTCPVQTHCDELGNAVWELIWEDFPMDPGDAALLLADQPEILEWGHDGGYSSVFEVVVTAVRQDVAERFFPPGCATAWPQNPQVPVR